MELGLLALTINAATVGGVAIAALVARASWGSPAARRGLLFLSAAGAAVLLLLLLVPFGPLASVLVAGSFASLAVASFASGLGPGQGPPLGPPDPFRDREPRGP